MNKLLNSAIHASLQAGAAIMEIYASDDFGVETKDDNSPLTKADRAAHDIIMEHLSPLGIPVLSEEGKNIPYEERKDWKQLWIVDPIDGTKEFIKRNGEFTVNIALIEDHIPIMGVIYVPAKKTLYYADHESAYRLEDVTEDNYEQNKTQAAQLPLAPNKLITDNRSLITNSDSNRVPEKQITVVASKSHLSPETQDFIDDLKTKHDEVKTISKGSSLKLCMVAEGTADYYPRFAPTMEWDTAAGQAICMAAGCDVIDQKTEKTMVYNRMELLNNWFLVKSSEFRS
jgi:3'(2'), 5'-bisphosphate nucleotidase